MASSSSSIYVIYAGSFVILVSLWSSCVYANECYTSIISFGDSLADTGNLKQIASEYNQVLPMFLPPYGQNFVNRSTGRCSNGRLIIDFVAESFGLPLIPPFLQDNKSGIDVAFTHGVNYAVAGATALDPRGIVNPMTNTSLRVQFAWFKQSLPSICGNSSNCRNFIGRSLILLGEIGGNDYNYPLFVGKPIREIELLVPLVIDTIISTIKELIEMGAKTIVVPGNFPIGCLPTFLTVYDSENEDYDPETGCLIRLNQFSEYHNILLQAKLNQEQELHHDVSIIYADYYNAAMPIYLYPYKFGFTNGALKACCGGEGQYNVNSSTICGEASTIVCNKPDTYVSWDGLHLTEAAYRIISKNLFSTPHFDSLCSTSTSRVGLSVST